MGLVGHTAPRLYTKPLRELTPDTSLGFEVIDFARDILGVSLLPWQEWLVTHLFELLPDGTLRFRRMLVIVARQNGKSFLLQIISLWVMWRLKGSTVLGVAQLTTTALEAWEGAIALAEASPDLQPLATAKGAVRRSNGTAHFKLGTSRYLTAAQNRRAGRGLSINCLILDELREMRTWDSYAAVEPTISAQEFGFLIGISNAGDDESVVLNALRESALDAEDEGVGIYEWSAREDRDIADPEGWCEANPSLGERVKERDLRIALSQQPPHVFRTERLNQRVRNLTEAVDLTAWGECADDNVLVEGRVYACIDVSPDGKHVSLVAASERPDGRVAIEGIDSWDSTSAALAALPELVRRVKPVRVGFFSSGPSKAVKTGLAQLPRAQELKAEDAVTACMTFADQIAARRVIHSNQDLINAHIASAQRMKVGDGWRFMRTDLGQCDAAYATAGAVLLVRMQPRRKERPRFITAHAA